MTEDFGFVDVQWEHPDLVISLQSLLRHESMKIGRVEKQQQWFPGRKTMPAAFVPSRMGWAGMMHAP